jgi:hypothetical protein
MRFLSTDVGSFEGTDGDNADNALHDCEQQEDEGDEAEYFGSVLQEALICIGVGVFVILKTEIDERTEIGGGESSKAEEEK